MSGKRRANHFFRLVTFVHSLAILFSIHQSKVRKCFAIYVFHCLIATTKQFSIYIYDICFLQYFNGLHSLQQEIAAVEKHSQRATAYTHAHQTTVQTTNNQRISSFMAAFRQLYLQCATNASTRTHYGARFPFTHRSAPSKKLPHRWHIFSSSSLSFSLLPMILFRCTFKFRSVFFLYFGQLFVFCIAFVLTSRFFPVDSVQVCSRLSVSLVFIRSFGYNCSRWGFFFIALQFFSAALHLLVFSHWLVSRACFPSHTLFRVHTFTRVS